MFARLSEQRMHWVRWILTIAWLGIIASLFYDPWTSALTVPNHPWSPLRLPDSCIAVKEECLVEQPYPLGTTVFWGAIVPSAITEAGDTCRELLLLIEGDAKIHFHLPDNEVRIESLHPGQTLDELEVLAHSDSKNTIVAASEITRILAVPVDTFDALLDRDFARRVLELESRQLQKFMRSLQNL